MASERALKWRIAASIAALMALTVCADALAPAPTPRRIVLCALLGLIPLSLLWQCMRRLGLRAARPQRGGGTASPSSGCGNAVEATQGMVLADTVLALEARLEHAPIALFCIHNAAGTGTVAPLNASARRLLAPGRASTPQHLQQLLTTQAAGQRKLISYDTERGTERALLAVAALTIQGTGQRLAALMPVESELEAEALHAWRELVHVLTHEIMNSLTPVASLSRTACSLLEEARAELPADIYADLGTALDAIARRAASLADFVGSYRSLSTMPQAQPQRVLLNALFERLAMLLAPQWQALGGGVVFSVEPASLEVMIDPDQLEQALINLLKNAAEAMTDMAAPQARVHARLSRGGRLHIEVADNGPGVPEALATHIFTPFFSTKKQGRGIGLAIVRHLVHGNGGTVRYARSVSAGARFLLTF
ncbi:MAG TPA: ATP-binding protein [Telluria sp.]|nr:ATP-binding protein [Telluria sp.]